MMTNLPASPRPPSSACSRSAAPSSSSRRAGDRRRRARSVAHRHALGEPGALGVRRIDSSQLSRLRRPSRPAATGRPMTGLFGAIEHNQWPATGRMASTRGSSQTQATWSPSRRRSQARRRDENRLRDAPTRDDRPRGRGCRSRSLVPPVDRDVPDLTVITTRAGIVALESRVWVLLLSAGTDGGLGVMGSRRTTGSRHRPADALRARRRRPRGRRGHARVPRAGWPMRPACL